MILLIDFHDHHLTLPPWLISPLKDLGTVDQTLDPSRLSINHPDNKEMASLLEYLNIC